MDGEPARASPDDTRNEMAAHAMLDTGAVRGDDPIIVRVTQSQGVLLALYTSAIVLALGAIYVAKALLMPMALAFMLTLALSPVVRALSRLGLPEAVSAMLVVIVLAGVLAAGVLNLSGPIQGWIADAPGLGRQVEAKLRQLRAPVDAARDATRKIEGMVESDDPDVQKVTIEQSGILTDAASGALSFAATVGVTFVLLFFLLASGRMFYDKLVRALPSLTEKKRAIRIAHAVEKQVSGYLFTIALINVSLGLVIAALMYAMGMPNPVLWGAMAALLNFIPYVGALIGLAVVSAVALITFDTLGQAVLTGGVFAICTVLEGQLITPTLVGRRLELNTVAVFIAVALWGWLWGIPGALIAVPLLVSLRVLCEHIEALSTLGEFISAAPPAVLDDDEPD